MSDHDSHKWRFSDSSYYDAICEKCNVPEGSQKASEPCPPRTPSKRCEMYMAERYSAPEIAEIMNMFMDHLGVAVKFRAEEKFIYDAWLKPGSVLAKDYRLHAEVVYAPRAKV